MHFKQPFSYYACLIKFDFQLLAVFKWVDFTNCIYKRYFSTKKSLTRSKASATSPQNLHTKCISMHTTTGANFIYFASLKTILHSAKSFIGTPEMKKKKKKKTFVSKDKLNCTWKKYTVSMASVNVILQDRGIHSKLINISTVTDHRLLPMVSF